MERGIIGERTSDALKRKIENGEHVGHIPFGYKIEGRRYSFLPEQEVIKLAKELRGRGYTLQAIGKGKFKTRGIRTKRGKNQWGTRQSIRNILTANL